MLSFNEIKLGSALNIDGQPYLVVKTDHLKMGRGGAVLRTKMRNLINGAVLERTFKPSDQMIEADLEQRRANFLYREGAVFNFMDNESYEQFTIDQESVGPMANYVKDGEDVDVLYFNQKPVSISLPPKVSLKVVQAPPGVKGDSATNATKRVTLETGYEIDVPLFIKEGEMLRINTATGQYVERVN